MYEQMLQFVHSVWWVYGYVLIAGAILSWIPDFATTRFGAALDRLIYPYMRLFDRWVPSIQLGGVAINLSYLVGLLVFFAFQQVAFTALSNLMMQGALR